MYRIKSWVILAGLVVLFTIVGYLVFDGRIALFVLGIGIFMNRMSSGFGAALILKMHRARPVHPREFPLLFQIAERLAYRAAIPMPALAYYPSDMPNAFTLDPGDGRAVVAVSSGLLHLLDRREMTGVLAHEFAHLKNQDTRITLSAGLFAHAISTLSTMFNVLILFMVLSRAWSLTGLQALVLIGVVGLAPHVAVALQAALSRERERLADHDAAALTGDPRGLASALYRMQQYSRHLSRYLRRFRFIYTVDLEAGPRWLQTHPPTDERIAALLREEPEVPAPPRSYRSPAGAFYLRSVA